MDPTTIKPDAFKLQGDIFPKPIVHKLNEKQVLAYLTSANTLISAQYGLWCIACDSEQEAFEILTVAINTSEQ